MRGQALWLFLFGSIASGCATYREDLNRGQRLYEENRYEHALAIWRNLEPDTDSLSFSDQARYSYLRGMTDYRLGLRADSRHWLALARATEGLHPGGLSPEWQERLGKSLEELNREVYGGDAKLGEAPPAASNEPPSEPSKFTLPPTP